MGDKSYCERITNHNCADVIGFQSVYRVWFAFTMFFLLMGILTIGVKSSKDCRGHLQNGLVFVREIDFQQI